MFMQNIHSQIHHAHLQIVRSLRALKIAEKVCKRKLKKKLNEL